MTTLPLIGKQYPTLAAISTAAASPSVLGLLEAGTALVKGNAYCRFGGAWQLLTPGSASKAEGVTGVVDKLGNVIADGNPVDVTGLGYVDGGSYYVENVDAQGHNFAVSPSPLTTALMPTPQRSYLSIGTAISVSGRMLLVYRMQANIDPAAVPA